jgi:hypothetical protein
MSRKRNINTLEWLNKIRENIKRGNSAIPSLELDEQLAQRLNYRYDDLNRKKPMSLRSPPKYNPGAVLNLPRANRVVHSNNSPQWVSIIGEKLLKQNPYLQSNRLDSLIANEVKAKYLAMAIKRQQQQQQQRTQKPSSRTKPKSVKRKARFGFARLFGR